MGSDIHSRLFQRFFFHVPIRTLEYKLAAAVITQEESPDTGDTRYSPQECGRGGADGISHLVCIIFLVLNFLS